MINIFDSVQYLDFTVFKAKVWIEGSQYDIYLKNKYIWQCIISDSLQFVETLSQYELRADTVSECKAWIDAIKMAR